MKIETKTLRQYEDMSEYLPFGWEHTEDTKYHSGRMTHTGHVLARDKEMPNYEKISALEQAYFSLKRQIKVYDPADPLLVIVLFVLLILPGVLYLVAKSSQKQAIEEHNQEIQTKMNEVLEEVKNLR